MSRSRNKLGSNTTLKPQRKEAGQVPTSGTFNAPQKRDDRHIGQLGSKYDQNISNGERHQLNDVGGSAAATTFKRGIDGAFEEHRSRIS